ncbi:hypothetical protein BSPLISOX_762 [uncultured Gammaproteobacteria bacterium]|jgi:hypothetical protein|nr:hypothetical protein [uncultured Gammaproteobacteria bacterium]CAC9453153.1 hypothetical protein [uncultured Gammaproteobacteria bacterium]VVH67288.1 hypothetical protein BSPLISOX_762 [uncultured Gammaproteobacteria bacterium]
MTFNLPSNFKNLVILIIVNMCIIFAVYSIYSDKSNNISPLYLKQKISAEEVVANNLQERLIILKNLFEAVDKFDLTEQVLNFKIIISVFDGIRMSAFEANKKGFVYAIKGETNDIILLAYKINKSINNNTIKAQTQELLIQGDSSALKVQIFGVNND